MADERELLRREAKKFPASFQLRGMRHHIFRIDPYSSKMAGGRPLFLLEMESRGGTFQPFAYARAEEIRRDMFDEIGEVESRLPSSFTIERPEEGTLVITIPPSAFSYDAKGELWVKVFEQKRMPNGKLAPSNQMLYSLRELYDYWAKSADVAGQLLADLFSSGSFSYKKLSRLIGIDVRNRTLPKNFSGTWTTAHGFRVSIEPSRPGAPHRIRLRCPCGKPLTSGRVFGHLRSNEHRRAMQNGRG